MKRILFIGMPGAGKGTQAKMLVEKGFSHISTGDLIREAWKKEDPEIMKFKEHIEAGGFLPDENIFKLLEKNLPKEGEGYILDGAVRTINQAKEVKKRKIVEEVVFFSIHKQVALERLHNRNESRADDSPEAIEKRFEIYERETHPTVDYLKENFTFYEVDADFTPEEIHEDVLKTLGIN